jgi:hypothetical protein
VADDLPYPFLQDPEEMARFGGWSKEQLERVEADDVLFPYYRVSAG